jgi:hypothetical protein
MKLKELKTILYSKTGDYQWAIVYDWAKNIDLATGCSIEYAIEHYGECEVKRIRSCYEADKGQDYLVIII